MPDAETIAMNTLNVITTLKTRWLMSDLVLMHPSDHAKLDHAEKLWGLPIIVCDKAKPGRPMVATYGPTPYEDNHA